MMRLAIIGVLAVLLFGCTSQGQTGGVTPTSGLESTSTPQITSTPTTLALTGTPTVSASAEELQTQQLEGDVTTEIDDIESALNDLDALIVADGLQ